VIVRELDPGAGPALQRGDVAVLLWGAAGRDQAARGLRALLAHTPAGHPIVLTGDADVRRLLDEAGPGGGERDAWWAGARPVAEVVDALAPADVALVHADAEVADGWLDGLRAAARDTGAGTATALANHAGLASVPKRNLPWGLLPPELTLDEAAARVRAAALGNRPRLPVALGHCALLARPALDLAGAPDPTRLADWSARATAAGLTHVLADDVLVAHRGGAGDGGGGAADPATAAALAEASEDRHSALARTLLVASRALRRPTVTIDARGLTGGLNGTKVHTLELIAALARLGDGPAVRVVMPDRPGEEAAAALGGVPGLELVPEREVVEGIARTDVVHRPWQADSPGDLRVLDLLGERIVVTHQDLIGYRTPSVFDGAEAWQEHRRLTAEALGLAAITVFFSATARDDALAEDLVEADRTRVVPIGVDHRLVGCAEPVAPPAAAHLAGRPFLVCLGTRFLHKQSPFALELLAALRAEHGFEGALVLAGADVLHGSATGAEAAVLAARPGLAEHVVSLTAVSEGEKAWLYAHAAAVVAPSTYEGFGLVPFEAAAAGTPCLYAPVSAHAELLGAEHAALVPWDAAASAQRAAAVLADPGPVLRAVAATGAELTWDRAARGLVAAYDDAVRLPSPAQARLTGTLARVEHDYWSLRDSLGEHAWALVGPQDGLLDREAQHDLAVLARRSPAGLDRLLRVARRLPGRRG
jgi:glycosyltransferase involved in cell wall biosynthesis